MINNAGVVARGPSEDLPEADWDRVMAVNLKGTFLCARAVGQVMIRQGGGGIINIASIMSESGIPQRLAYSTSKGGVAQLTRTLAVEWACHNIRVNAIAPGYLDTPLTRPLYDQDPEFYDYVIRKTPMRRIIRPEEVVGAAVFLASDASTAVTGQVLAVDGGWLAE